MRQYFDFKAGLEQLLGVGVDLEIALQALQRVSSFLGARTLEQYLDDELCRSAVERQLVVSFRNLLAHGYATLDHARVYQVASERAAEAGHAPVASTQGSVAIGSRGRPAPPVRQRGGEGDVGRIEKGL